MSSSQPNEPKIDVNSASDDDSPVIGSIDSIQEKQASDLESGIFDSSTEAVPATSPNTDRDNDIIYWSGPEDPENPLNWSRKKRVSHVALVSVITFIS
jgi:hypothetical protein